MTSTIQTVLPSNPTLSTSGISVVGNRGTILSGGVLKIGKWRYVDIVFKLSATLSANNYWAILTGFDAPLGGYAALNAPICSKNGGACIGYIDSSNGNLTLETAYGTPSPNETIAINGWYLTA